MKMEKLELMIKLASEKNIDQVGYLSHACVGCGVEGAWVHACVRLCEGGAWGV